MSTSRPRRRRDSSQWNVHVAAAASPRLVSAEYPDQMVDGSRAGDDGGWRLYCDSKNGVVVDGAFWCKGETVPLKNRSAIKFGPCACYFARPPRGIVLR